MNSATRSSDWINDGSLQSLLDVDPSKVDRGVSVGLSDGNFVFVTQLHKVQWASRGIFFFDSHVVSCHLKCYSRIRKLHEELNSYLL